MSFSEIKIGTEALYNWGMFSSNPQNRLRLSSTILYILGAQTVMQQTLHNNFECRLDYSTPELLNKSIVLTYRIINLNSDGAITWLLLSTNKITFDNFYHRYGQLTAWAAYQFNITLNGIIECRRNVPTISGYVVIHGKTWGEWIKFKRDMYISKSTLYNPNQQSRFRVKVKK